MEENSEIEREGAAQDYDPFDPRDIAISVRHITITSIMRKLESKTLCLAPDFQRNSIWKDVQKSRLIESILLKIPLPLFYVSETEDGIWDVVDGMQRLIAISEFVSGKTLGQNKADVSLSGLEFSQGYEDKKYVDLDNYSKEIILDTELIFIVISPRTPDDVKFNIFKRINTGGTVLNEQEIRHAMFQGKSTQLLQELANHPAFHAATGGSLKDERMEAREIILRMLSFLIRDYTYFFSKGFRSTDKAYTMDSFLSDTMIIINASPDFKSKKFRKSFKNGAENTFVITDTEEIKEKFVLAMRRAEMLFGEHAFRRSIFGTRTKVNKSLFDVWGSRLALIKEEDFLRLIHKKRILIDEYFLLLNETSPPLFLAEDFSGVGPQLSKQRSIAFADAISRYGQSPIGVKTRYERISSLLSNFGVR